jgi:hypothetical protein
MQIIAIMLLDMTGQQHMAVTQNPTTHNNTIKSKTKFNQNTLTNRKNEVVNM